MRWSKTSFLEQGGDELLALVGQGKPVGWITPAMKKRLKERGWTEGRITSRLTGKKGWASGNTIPLYTRAPQQEPGVLKQAIKLLQDGLGRIASTEKSQVFVTDGELAASYLAQADTILKAAPQEPGEGK